VVLASLPYGLLCTTVLMQAHRQDPVRRAARHRTLPVLLGEARARAVTLAMWSGSTCWSPSVLRLRSDARPALLVVLALHGLRKCGHTSGARGPTSRRRISGVAAVVRGGGVCARASAGALLVVGLAIGAVLRTLGCRRRCVTDPSAHKFVENDCQR